MAATSSMSYMSLRTNSLAKDAEEKRSANREKAMLIFAFQLLIEKGYLDTATSLASECSMKLEDFAICDNIDMRSIFLEFETYYHIRYQRYPQYFKKAPLSATETLLNQMKAQHLNKNSKDKKCSSAKPGKGQVPSNGGCEKSPELEEGPNRNPTSLNLHGRSSYFGLDHNNLNGAHDKGTGNNKDGLVNYYNISSTGKLLKPISGLDFPNDDARSFAELIQREIIVENLGTTWSDVIGLDDAKYVLQQTLHYTKEFLDFFGGGLSPWRGLLLYGPPGVGKTLLAKAVASECNTTFFNISSASLISKWRGDSEKIVKTLFDLARYHAPSTLFFDEFDALGSKRDGGANDSDASRRFKSELLQQIDGLMSSVGSEQIFILAATNLPWELDPAMLRRLEKRIYIPLPNSTEREQILQFYFDKTSRSVAEASQGRNAITVKMDFTKLAMVTENYSGSDLQQIVKETAVRKFREHYGQRTELRQLTIRTDDVLKTIDKVLPTVTNPLIEKYKKWATQVL